MKTSKKTYTDARAVAEKRLPAKDLNRAFTFNTKLRHIPNSPEHESFMAFLRPVAQCMEKHIPPDLRPPIASGPRRENIAWRTLETLMINVAKVRARGKRMLSLRLSPVAYTETSLSGTGLINLVRLEIGRAHV